MNSITMFCTEKVLSNQREFFYDALCVPTINKRIDKISFDYSPLLHLLSCLHIIRSTIVISGRAARRHSLSPLLATLKLTARFSHVLKSVFLLGPGEMPQLN